jgi:hypothetical protein
MEIQQAFDVELRETKSNRNSMYFFWGGGKLDTQAGRRRPL